MEEVVSVLEQLQETKDGAKKMQAEQKILAQSFGSGSQRPRIRSLEDSASAKVAYPRPLASPLFE